MGATGLVAPLQRLDMAASRVDTVLRPFHSEMMPVYLLAAFGKNEKANISAAEKHLLSKVVIALVEFWRNRNGQGIH